ncbi:MAG TPA: serine hydrolase domain-containing protein, partial [Bacillota bacterium]|nr:serine hydrolase domain-containing protein [Bacillota bacterium]
MNDHAAAMDRIFCDYDLPGSPGAAVAVIKDGQVAFTKGYGLAQLEYEVAITPDTIFHIASISKQFTCFAVCILKHQGLLSYDDDIRRYLPYVPDFGDTITIRHLMHHVSGLRDQWELLRLAGWRMDDVITQEHVKKLIS